MGITNYTHTEGFLISVIVSLMVKEWGRSYRRLLIMLNVLYLSFIEDKINSSQLVINHFLILKRSGFLFFYGAAFKESSPSNLNTGICNMERREGQPYFSRGPCYLLHVSGWLFKSLNCLLQNCVKKKNSNKYK